LAKLYVYLDGAWREAYTDAAPPTALGAVGTKNPPIDADKALYRDSVASDALVTSTWTQIKAFLKTYFDTLYAAITHASKHTDGSDDIQSATAAQKGLATAAQITKLDGIEAGAQVNDAETDPVFTAAVIDEDDMASNSDAKVPTQQSVKAYVDASGGVSEGTVIALVLGLGG
jgi:hypothetical protein